jgi:hypothetical protein
MMHKVKIVLFLIGFACLYSCKNSNKSNELDYGLSLNVQRLKDSLPVLPKEWKLEVNRKIGDNIELQWNNPKAEKHKSFLSKNLLIKNDKIIREENLFLGEEDYEIADGVFSEKIFVSADYTYEKKSIVKKITYEYSNKENISGKFVAKKFADSLITKWGQMAYFAPTKSH